MLCDTSISQRSPWRVTIQFSSAGALGPGIAVRIAGAGHRPFDVDRGDIGADQANARLRHRQAAVLEHGLEERRMQAPRSRRGPLCRHAEDVGELRIFGEGVGEGVGIVRGSTPSPARAPGLRWPFDALVSCHVSAEACLLPVTAELLRRFKPPTGLPTISGTSRGGACTSSISWSSQGKQGAVGVGMVSAQVVEPDQLAVAHFHQHLELLAALLRRRAGRGNTASARRSACSPRPSARAGWRSSGAAARPRRPW